MAYPPSSYGDRPPLQGYRRSFTTPARPLSFHEKAGLQNADAGTDILYSHPSARIILFSPPTDSLPTTTKDTLPDADYPVDAVEVLPWRSRTETLLSNCAIVIEKVRGSTWFLKSADQKVIQTIMRNSQCWCVDGESKFVLRTGKLRYYRIELPLETDQDRDRVRDLKLALPKVLRFEITPCPFKRAFHVDLPEDAITPRRKGTWKRRAPPEPTTPNTDPLPLRRSKTTRAWSLQGQASTPMQPYGRRGSDYGFRPSRDSSPNPRLDFDAYRPTTPSSLASSEEPGDGWRDEAQDDSMVHHEQFQSSHAMDVQTPGSECEVSAHLSEQESPQSDNEPEVPATISQDDQLAPTSATPEDVLREADKASMTVEAPPPEIVAPEEDQILVPEQTSASQINPLESKIDTTVESDASMPSGTATETAEEDEEEQDILASDVDVAQDGEPSSSVAAVEDHDAISQEDSALDPEVEPSSEKPIDNTITPAAEEDSLTRVSSTDSFFTSNSLTEESLSSHVDAIDFQKTPNAEQLDPFAMKVRQHKRDVSELTVTASTIDSFLDTSSVRPSTGDSIDVPTTPALAQSTTSDLSWPDVETPSSPLRDEGLRRRLKTQRSLSPLPPSPTLFAPGSPTHGSHFTAAFLQKACNLALVKPMEAVVLLVHILARIAGGATVNDLLNGELFKRPEQHRRSSSFPDQASSPRDDTDDEDDFGVPFRGRLRKDVSQAETSAVKDDDSDSMFDLD
ncbi:hypothetical protein PV10_00281 [Exophiala mesophila]|uniref:Inheritance of peroxisomes protein 1 n=1 Tax=Exophiala mesophila TaxID=212818 RepID=A0A0D1ZR17_EXOME|nr:uncharacterized protein PV10_00281 [Exophiala mesophila]KIV96409.1 hypothetical protein PV10_00281 [Exophiala mesophila]